MIDKKYVVEKNSSLLSKYTCEIPQKVESFISDEVTNELAKILKKEIDNEIMRSIMEVRGWFRVEIKNTRFITPEWCNTYIKGKYRCVGHCWYFEDQKDYLYFVLKWLDK